jgi:hypothetical protein
LRIVTPCFFMRRIITKRLESPSSRLALDAHCSSGLCDREGLQTASNGSRLLHLADVGLAIGIAGACATRFPLWERAHQKIQAGATNRGAAFLYSADFR